MSLLLHCDACGLTVAPIVKSEVPTPPSDWLISVRGTLHYCATCTDAIVEVAREARRKRDAAAPAPPPLVDDE